MQHEPLETCLVTVAFAQLPYGMKNPAQYNQDSAFSSEGLRWLEGRDSFRYFRHIDPAAGLSIFELTKVQSEENDLQIYVQALNMISFLDYFNLVKW